MLLLSTISIANADSIKIDPTSDNQALDEILKIEKLLKINKNESSDLESLNFVITGLDRDL